MTTNERDLGAHFQFGENWSQLVQRIDENHLRYAISDISTFMGRDSLEGLSFLDVGCGSGLSSLAAFRLGARPVTSVDIDPKNIDNVLSLKRKFGVVDGGSWTERVASIVNPGDVGALPTADIVYSWGVLHHTGAMWEAIENCIRLVRPNGYLYLMLYRDALLGPAWRSAKRFYTQSGPVTKFVIRNGFASFLVLGMLAKLKNPIRSIRSYPEKGSRGMEWYIDITDWVGGYPFEYASYTEVCDFVTARGFEIANIKPKPEVAPRFHLGYRGMGSFQYLFRRTAVR
jgi:2-polyprenyl-6-hydroxyphenyl methylase/3-demethylubiquinone-9 3-methyltransferase